MPTPNPSDVLFDELRKALATTQNNPMEEALALAAISLLQQLLNDVHRVANALEAMLPPSA